MLKFEIDDPMKKNASNFGNSIKSKDKDNPSISKLLIKLNK